MKRAPRDFAFTPRVFLWVPDGGMVWIACADCAAKLSQERGDVPLERATLLQPGDDGDAAMAEDGMSLPACDLCGVQGESYRLDLLVGVLADSMKREILMRGLAGATFADLHDVCDANVLGCAEDVFVSDAVAPEASAALTDVHNKAIEIVDAWLRAGRPQSEVTL